MTRVKWKKFALIVSCVLAFCSFTAFTVNALQNKLSQADKERAEIRIEYWGEIGEEYKIANYTDSVRVFDPNGKLTSVNEEGVFMLTTLGDYSIVYKDKTIKISALIEKPYTKMFFGTEEKSFSYIAGEKVELPSLTVTNNFYNFDYYYIDVVTGNGLIETLKVKNGEAPLYVMKESGQFSFDYFVVNDYGEKEQETISVSVVDEKHIFCQELPVEVQVGETIEIGWPYAYYQKKTYDVVCTLISSNGNEQILKNSTYVPSAEGEYTIKYSSVIDGTSVVVEQSFTVVPAEAAIFVSEMGNNTMHGLTDLPDWNLRKEYEKGFFVSSASSTSLVRYSNIIDLSTLTKEDNLISLLPYSVGETSYMGGIQLNLVDVYDSTNCLTIEFYQPQEYPNAYCVVLLNGKYYGMSNRSNLGALEISGYNGMGPSAFNTYLNKEPSVDGKSDMFCLQYDYEENTLFLTTGDPTQQYVFLPLSEKGEKPEGYSKYERLPENCFFNGFTSGEVYLTIGVTNNVNAGYYLCEVAGVKAEDMAFELENNFLVLDQYFETLPSGAVGYSYKVPTAKTNPAILDCDTLRVMVYDPNGKNIEVINGGFTPNTIGKYKIVYSTRVNDVRLQKEYYFEVKDKPNKIQIEMDEQTVAFGEIMPEPTIYVTGGAGKVSFTYEVLNGGVSLTADRSGGYLIAENGDVEVIVTATDITGYTEQKKFPVTVTDGQYFKLPTELPKSIRAGKTWTVPDAQVTKFNNGELYKEKANVTVFADGVKMTVIDGKITVASESKLLLVNYSYEYGGEEYTFSKVIDVLPEEITTIRDYLFTSDGVEKTITEAGIVLSVSKNGTAKLPYLIVAEKTVVVFGFHANLPQIQTLKIILQDGSSVEDCLVYTISNFDPVKGTVQIALNGEKAVKLQGTLAAYTQFAGDANIVEKYEGQQYVTFSVTFSAEGYIVNERTQEKLFAVNKFANGAPFDGFTQNSCEISLEWETKEKTEIIISQVGNQQFNYLNDIAGWTNNDNKGPEIVLYENFAPEYVSKGYTLSVPAAKSFDVLQGEYEVFVKIIKEGKMILDTKSASQAFDFVLDSYGTYTFVYESFDDSGNRGERRLNITVKDEIAPILTLNNSYVTTLKVGETITILDYTIEDRETGMATEQIFVKDDAGNLDFVEVNTKYKFTQSGVYEIVYRMLDKAGNMTRCSVAITVR